MMEMPPLPEGDRAARYDPAPAHSDEQMLAYAKEWGESCARMAREEESYIIDMLVAAGHVTAEKVAQAREIAAAIRKG